MGFLDRMLSRNKGQGPDSVGYLPDFRYHLDPVGDGTFIKTKEVCEVCGERRGYIYNNAFYSENEIGSICPWCISDGTAAKEYEGVFHDMEPEDTDIDPEKLDELMKRTPGFDCWQPVTWPCHCGDLCAFSRHVGWDDICGTELEEEIADDLERMKKDASVEKEELERTGSPAGYLFECRICGRHRLTTDIRGPNIKGSRDLSSVPCRNN